MDEFVFAQLRLPVITGNPELDSRPELAPWMWCLQLMERAQGLEASILNAAGVGGYFHFGYQSVAQESRQPPALYVLCDFPENQPVIPTWAFRIAFCEAALVVECPIRQQRFIIVNPEAWPAIAGFDQASLDEYRQEIDRKTLEQPFYNFCGFGTVNPRLRKRNPVVISNGTSYIISRGGEFSPEFDRMAKMVFMSDDEIDQSLKELQLRRSPSA